VVLNPRGVSGQDGLLPVVAVVTHSCVLSLMLIPDVSLLLGSKAGLLQKHPQCWERNSFQVPGEILKNIMENLTLSCVKVKLDPSSPVES